MNLTGIYPVSSGCCLTFADSSFQTQGTLKQNKRRKTTRVLSWTREDNESSSWTVTGTCSVTRKKKFKWPQRAAVSQVIAAWQRCIDQRLCSLEEDDKDDESAVMEWSVRLLLSACCPSLAVTHGWRRICSRVGRSDGSWLRHQPISCWHSIDTHGNTIGHETAAQKETLRTI